MISFLIEQVLTDEGFIVVGPFDTVSLALSAAQNEQLDGAVLDVNVAGEQVYPVAEALAKRDIPFFFLSGYGDNAVPAGHPEWQVCCKPFRVDELILTLKRALEGKSVAKSGEALDVRTVTVEI